MSHLDRGKQGIRLMLLYEPMQGIRLMLLYEPMHERVGRASRKNEAVLSWARTESKSPTMEADLLDRCAAAPVDHSAFHALFGLAQVIELLQSFRSRGG